MILAGKMAQSMKSLQAERKPPELHIMVSNFCFLCLYFACMHVCAPHVYLVSEVCVTFPELELQRTVHSQGS